ncbi:MAG: ABC transporter ATP-binding protein [Treponema sp.]|jgi:NitT/TauT family transport system ATP-binding protein|nr:ABC transporter ATP-binding protein [Treponema sp.]
MIRVSLKNISFGFGSKRIFENFNLELGEENPVVILGPSGCGKTTLLKLIAGLLAPEKGEVSGPSAAFVFQEPRLLPWKTVLANVSLPLEKNLGKAEAEARAFHYLRFVSLADRAGAWPDELSGGQRQRAGIARAFAYPAPLILMDEPFQSLDIPLRRRLMDLTLRLLAESGRTLAAVTHDPAEAVHLGKRIIILGRRPKGIVFDGRYSGDPAFRAGLEEKLAAALAGETE